MALWKLPAVVLAFLAWWSAPPNSLADAGRREAVRRQVSPHATRAYTNQDLPPAPELPVVAAEPPVSEQALAGAVKPGEVKPEDEKTADEKHDEKWWRERVSSANATLDRDQGLAAAMQSHVNALTTDWINRDNPVQKAQLFDERRARCDVRRRRVGEDLDVRPDQLAHALVQPPRVHLADL